MGESEGVNNGVFTGILIAEGMSMFWYNRSQWVRRVGDRCFISAIIYDTGLMAVINLMFEKYLCLTVSTVMDIAILSGFLSTVFFCLEAPHVAHDSDSFTSCFWHSLHKFCVIFIILFCSVYFKDSIKKIFEEHHQIMANISKSETVNICSSEDVDFTVFVGDFCLGCNRKTLSEQSGYFQAMFDSQMKESLSGSVTLHGTDAADVIHVKTLLTSVLQPIAIDTSNVFPLTRLASLYQFHNVLSSCCKFLVNNITHSNCLSIMDFAEECFLEEIFYLSKVHSLWHFQHVVKQDEFKSLTHSRLLQYLNSSYLNCTQEITLTDAIEVWLEHHKEDSWDMREILENNFYPDDMSHDELKVLLNKDWVNQNSKIHDIIQSALKRKLEIVEPSHEVRHRKLPHAILHLDRHLPGEEPFLKTNMFYFNPEGCDIEPIDQIESSVICKPVPLVGAPGFQATVVGDKIYVTGGEWKLGRNTWEMRMWIYNCLSLQWFEGPRLTKRRRHHGTCTDGDHLFLLGGFGAYRTILDDVEQLNVHTGEWSNIPSMLQPEFSPTATVCGRAMYLFKTCIQRYSFDTSQWSYLTLSNPIRLNITHAYVEDDMIYLCSTFGNSVKVFNPHITELSELCSFQSECGNCILYRRKLYWFSRMSGSSAVEYYDLDTRKHLVLDNVKNCTLEGILLTVPKYPCFRLCKKEG